MQSYTNKTKDQGDNVKIWQTKTNHHSFFFISERGVGSVFALAMHVPEFGGGRF